MRRLLVLVVSIACAAVAFAQSAQAADPPPTLTGEIFTISPATVTYKCNPAGTSTVSYSVSGTAVGPYAGTYTESGTFTIGTENLQQFVDGFQAGPITGASVSFSISSPTGHVTGTKSLPAQSPDAWGICYSPTLGGGTFAELCACNNSLSYSATINGQYGDQGISGLILDLVQGTVITPIFPPQVIQQTNTFMESFVSSGLVPFLLCEENSQVNQGQGGNNQGCKNP